MPDRDVPDSELIVALQAKVDAQQAKIEALERVNAAQDGIIESLKELNERHVQLLKAADSHFNDVEKHLTECMEMVRGADRTIEALGRENAELRATLGIKAS